MPTLYTPTPDEEFIWDRDAVILIGDQGVGSGVNATATAIEAPITIGLDSIKVPDAIGKILGYSYIDPAFPYRLKRVNPQRSPRFPWAVAYALTSTELAPESNGANPAGEPYATHPVSGIRFATYQREQMSISFATRGRMKFLDDNDIDVSMREWQRNVRFSVEPAITTLQIDGYNLKFTESVTPGGPNLTAPVPPSAPVQNATLRPGMTLRARWEGVAHDYVSSEPDVLYPDKILAALGTWNTGTMFDSAKFTPGSLLLLKVGFEPIDLPVMTTDLNDPLCGWNVLLDWDYNPVRSTKPGSEFRGHRVFPHRNSVPGTDGIMWFHAVMPSGGDYLPGSDHDRIWMAAADPA